MHSRGEKTGDSRSDFLLLLVLMPIASLILLLAGAKPSSQVSNDGSPHTVTEQNQVSTLPSTPIPTSIPPQVIEPTTAIQPGAPANVADTNAEFLALYGEHVYPTLQSMPADMLTWYLTWVHRVAVYFDVPEEDILSVHYAELMGGGFNPLESRRSTADAGGPGQIIPETWNGWSCGSNQSVFMTDPQEISRCGGLGRDFDGDGIANVDSLPDNLAATALHIKFDGISSSLRSDAAQHEAVLRDALAQYNSNRSYWQAPQITRTYVDIGLSWWRENSALIAVYLEVYAPNA